MMISFAVGFSAMSNENDAASPQQPGTLSNQGTSDFSAINELLARVSVVMPPVQASALGLDLSLSGMTCSGMRLSNVTLITQRIDAHTSSS